MSEVAALQTGKFRREGIGSDAAKLVTSSAMGEALQLHNYVLSPTSFTRQGLGEVLL